MRQKQIREGWRGRQGSGGGEAEGRRRRGRARGGGGAGRAPHEGRKAAERGDSPRPAPDARRAEAARKVARRKAACFEKLRAHSLGFGSRKSKRLHHLTWRKEEIAKVDNAPADVRAVLGERGCRPAAAGGSEDARSHDAESGAARDPRGCVVVQGSTQKGCDRPRPRIEPLDAGHLRTNDGGGGAIPHESLPPRAPGRGPSTGP